MGLGLPQESKQGERYYTYITTIRWSQKSKQRGEAVLTTFLTTIGRYGVGLPQESTRERAVLHSIVTTKEGVNGLGQP